MAKQTKPKLKRRGIDASRVKKVLEKVSVSHKVNCEWSSIANFAHRFLDTLEAKLVFLSFSINTANQTGFTIISVTLIRLKDNCTPSATANRAVVSCVVVESIAKKSIIHTHAGAQFLCFALNGIHTLCK